MADDRESLTLERPVVLLIEDDVAFAMILRDLARELGFQALVALDGATGLGLARKYVPSAVVLDVRLPDHSGLAVLDRLKQSKETSTIPVHVMSVADHQEAAIRMGAVGFLLKPVDREALAAVLRGLEGHFRRRGRRLLVVDDDVREREALAQLLGSDDVTIVGVSSVQEALALLRSGTFDCVVTDLTLPEASGFDLLERMAEDEAYAFPPTIVYTDRELTPDEEQRLRKHSRSIILKGAKSQERLLDEVTLFLHEVDAEQPSTRRRPRSRASEGERIFQGKRILVAEDDVRNVFALTSVLESKGATVRIARNGREAVEALESDAAVDLVLMDIMMPEMDGLQAMREIRRRPEGGKIPIIALTAKAMPDDQQQCRDAGANDFIAKPLDVDVLVSLLRVWMPR